MGVLIGLGLSVCFAYLSFLYAIHDGFRVAAYLFPYAVLLLIQHVGMGSLAWSRVNSKPVKVTVENTPLDHFNTIKTTGPAYDFCTLC